MELKTQKISGAAGALTSDLRQSRNLSKKEKLALLRKGNFNKSSALPTAKTLANDTSADPIMLKTPIKNSTHTTKIDTTPAKNKAAEMYQHMAGQDFNEKDVSDAMNTE